jgi:hypothetical protein
MQRTVINLSRIRLMFLKEYRIFLNNLKLHQSLITERTRKNILLVGGSIANGKHSCQK